MSPSSSPQLTRRHHRSPLIADRRSELCLCSGARCSVLLLALPQDRRPKISDRSASAPASDCSASAPESGPPSRRLTSLDNPSLSCGGVGG
nr:hypothetical protein CFP56_74337 [Quercus suber]